MTELMDGEKLLCRMEVIETADNKTEVRLEVKCSPEAYGLIVCDLVRHAAKGYKIKEEEIWAWVDVERNHPTTEVHQVRVV